MNSNQTVPTPHQIFKRLIQTDYKPAECEDEAAKLRQQREILIQLICEYEEEIKKAHMLALEEQQLADLKERLLHQLQTLKIQRGRIDSKLSQELNVLKVSPVEIRDHESWVVQINDSRSRNNGLKVRIKDLMMYIQKLEIQNRRLQEEKKIIQVNQLHRLQSKDDWRYKIDVLQKQYLSYENQLRDRIRMKQQESLKKAHAQQMQIQERNERRRMQSLSGNRHLSSHSRIISSPGVLPMPYPYVRRI